MSRKALSNFILLWSATVLSSSLATAANDARILTSASAVPGNVFPAAAASVRIRVQNVGTTTWTAGAAYRLGAQDNPAIARVELIPDRLASRRDDVFDRCGGNGRQDLQCLFRAGRASPRARPPDETLGCFPSERSRSVSATCVRGYRWTCRSCAHPPGGVLAAERARSLRDWHGLSHRRRCRSPCSPSGQAVACARRRSRSRTR